MQVTIAAVLLLRRMRRLAARSWLISYGRFVLAALPAAAAGWLVYQLMGGDQGWTTTDKLLGALGTAIVCGVAFIVYLGVLALLRAPELRPVLDELQRFLPSGR